MFDTPQGNIPQLNIEYFFNLLYRLITDTPLRESVASFLSASLETINTVSFFLAPLLLFGIIYVAIRKQQIMKLDKERFAAEVAKARSESRGNERWRKIVDLVSSDNPTEWRHGVIEADVLLDELLKERGYIGESLGERLKSVPQGVLRSLDAAWEAHKVRNEIAHAGSDFILTQREARRAIDNYRQVFEELGAL